MTAGNRPPKWDIFEAVILLKGYLDVIEKNEPKSKVVKRVSMDLRKMAINRGLEIDDVYRNENGISYQIQGMESAFKGHTIYVSASKLFRDTVELYRNDEKRFYEIYEEAKNMVEISRNTDNKDAFLQWASSLVVPVKYKWLDQNILCVEDFAKKHNLITESIYKVSETDVLYTILKKVQRDRIFQIRNKKFYNNIIDDFMLYIRFVSEQGADTVPVENKGKITDSDTMNMEGESAEVEGNPDTADDVDIMSTGESSASIHVGTKEAGQSDATTEGDLGKVINTIRQEYFNGIRFDDTVIRLLEQSSSVEMNTYIQEALKKRMFQRSDGLYFLLDVISNSAQLELLEKKHLLNEIEHHGCVDIKALFSLYNKYGKTTCFRDEKDFEDYIILLIPDGISITGALKTRIIRNTSISATESLTNAARNVTFTIEESGGITQEDLQAEYPLLEPDFLVQLINKYTDNVIQTEINGFLCYQTIESLGLDEEFGQILTDCLDELDALKISASQEILHALISLKLGYNLKDEYNIRNDKTFRRMISECYNGSKKRRWKSGIFSEVSNGYV